MRLLKVVFGVFMVMAINCVFVFGEGQQIFALTVPSYVAPSEGYQSQPAAPQYGQQPGYAPQPAAPQYGQQPGYAPQPAAPQYGQQGYAPQPGAPQYGPPSSAYPNAGETPLLGYPVYGLPQPSYYYPLEYPAPNAGKSATTGKSTGKKGTAPSTRKKTGRAE